MKHLALIAVLFAGCAALPKYDSDPPLSRQKDYSPWSGITFIVEVRNEGLFQPHCSIPDAAKTTTCQFTIEWLRKGSMETNEDGWRTMSIQSARDACHTAFFPLRGLIEQGIIDENDLNTCANLLMYIRIIDLQ
jgi:hypothetical protein